MMAKLVCRDSFVFIIIVFMSSLYLIHSLTEAFWEGVTIEEKVCCVQLYVVTRHVPNAFIVATLAPRILYHIVGLAAFINRFTVDEHHMVVGEAPIFPLLLTHFLCGCHVPDAVAVHRYDEFQPFHRLDDSYVFGNTCQQLLMMTGEDDVVVTDWTGQEVGRLGCV